jgi:hypothetical protein
MWAEMTVKCIEHPVLKGSSPARDNFSVVYCRETQSVLQRASEHWDGAVTVGSPETEVIYQ